MVLCASGDIFQAKLNNILGDIDGINTCIEDTLILGKGIFSHNIYQLRVIFAGIPAKGLKLNPPQFIILISVIFLHGKGLNPIKRKYKGLCILSDLPRRPKRESSFGWSSTIGTCGLGSHMY